MKIYVKPISELDARLDEVLVADDSEPIASIYQQFDPANIKTPTSVLVLNPVNNEMVELPINTLVKKLHHLTIIPGSSGTVKLAFTTTEVDGTTVAQTGDEVVDLDVNIPLALDRANTVVNLARL